MATQRLTPELRHLNAVLAQLSTNEDPVTFYDALALMRQIRRTEELPDALIHGLVALHDAEHITDGAREILAEMLRSYAQRHAKERELAERPILLKDSGKTARAVAGTSLLISLDERRGSGFRWVVQQVRGPARCRRRVDRAVIPVRAELDVTLTGVGRAHLDLEESPPPSPQPPRGTPPEEVPRRRFELTVVVEPGRRS